MILLHSWRVARHQVLVDASRACWNQTALFIVTQQDHPIIDRIWPFAIREKPFGLCSQRTEQSRNVAVTPAGENHFSLVVCTQVSRQLSGLLVPKAGIDWQFCCLCEWFDCQTGPVA